MFYKTIRFKIAIVYMIILALTLSGFSAVLYHYVDRSLNENMETLLRSKAEGIVHAINTYWAAARLGSKRFGVKAESAVSDGDINFSTIAQKWVQEKSKDPKLLDIIVQIFDADGVAIASSKNTQGITSVSRNSLISVLQGKSCFDTLTSSFPTKKAQVFKVFITPAIQNDKVEYIVQVASPLSSIQTALYSLKVILFLLFPVTVLMTGIMGAFLAKLTLRPVDSMIKTIHGITAENMKLKIAVPATKDEIQKLAETFNDMLSRLDNAFTSQKQFFEDLSHELKTPLTVLKGEFEVVLKKMRSQGEYESILRSSLEEINKITRIVENLLVLASFESQKILPERKEIDLGLLIQGVVNSIKPLALQKRLEMDLRMRESTIVKGDDQQLKHLFLNIIDNAIKYSKDRGVINISVEKKEGYARITIADTGIGIPEGEMGRIFERFYRADKSGSDKGFGLGLSIAKAIVDSHNGLIEAVSRQGQGATFIINLPLVSS